MPHLHVRWQTPWPHVEMNATSIPGGNGTKPPPRPRRPSQAPAKTVEDGGCYGGCWKCNKCAECRGRTCNGRCSKCSTCPRCKAWGERLDAGEAKATSMQEEAALLPAVEKKVVKDTGNQAKMAATAARPKDAPRAMPVLQKMATAQPPGELPQHAL